MKVTLYLPFENWAGHSHSYTNNRHLNQACTRESIAQLYLAVKGIFERSIGKETF